MAGKSIKDLPESSWPCCVPERAMFMADFEYVRHVDHPYKKFDYQSHRHLETTPLRHPPYSAPAVPFRWMFSEGIDEFAEEYEIDVDSEREPDVINGQGRSIHTTWVQGGQNQRGLLDCFFGHVRPEHSLVFFYAKQLPFVEEPGRVLVGVGRVRHVGDSVEYLHDVDNPELRPLLWERLVQHSIRPTIEDGFLLPYHQAIEAAQRGENVKLHEIAAMAPADRHEEFSYAAEHVSHDGAIDALISCQGALQRASEQLGKDFTAQLKWIDRELGKLWQMRGPCPGLGAALSAFGIQYGTFVAREIEAGLAENEDPWPVVEAAFGDPEACLSTAGANELTAELREAWRRLPDVRRDLLKLLSRFTLTVDQAKMLYVQEVRAAAKITDTDTELLENPYRIYEATRLHLHPVSIRAVDHGVFPEKKVRDKHPLPAASTLKSGTDSRRVRALVVSQLEHAAGNGHTLLARKEVILKLRGQDIQPVCEMTGDLMTVVEDAFEPEIISVEFDGGEPAYQLGRLAEVGAVVRRVVTKRVGAKRHVIDADWRALLDAHLDKIGGIPEDPALEESAREEKASALAELAASRFTALAGPAGTGKTLLLTVLCSQPAIATGDVLLLAPTGRARVRMEQAAKQHDLRLNGQTIAQFLHRSGRFEGETGRYRIIGEPGQYVADTVVVDEASMLTEEMLAALLEALKGVKRLILIGDPSQLPPIGAGRPFSDIVSHLRPESIDGEFPRVADGYAELTVHRRQGSADRDDLRLAQWFGGRQLDPASDDIFTKISSGDPSPNLKLVRWDSADDLQERLMEVLVAELELDGNSDSDGFERKLGGTQAGDYIYFNRGNAKHVEEWQILSPVRGLPHGVAALNRSIHGAFRSETIEFANRAKFRRIPRPMGSEEIVYGDKVICIRNHTRNNGWPKDDALGYIANGEVGLVIGQFKTKKVKGLPSRLNVEFSSQPNISYTFGPGEFSDEGSPILELAYALTVHKAQGSEFGLVILIVPNPCHLLSRELLYTALTRQKEKVVVLHQGDRSSLKALASDEFSVSASRLTNLLAAPRVREWKDRLFDDRLIHLTSRGEFVRSKSEVIIADHLHQAGVDYTYEKPLELGGHLRYPDFTIEDEDTGEFYFWEHCGMLHVPEYERRWKAKLAWYRENGVLSYEEGGGEGGHLIVTRDSEKGAISSPEIDRVIREVLIG